MVFSCFQGWVTKKTLSGRCEIDCARVLKPQSAMLTSSFCWGKLWGKASQFDGDFYNYKCAWISSVRNTLHWSSFAVSLWCCNCQCIWMSVYLNVFSDIWQMNTTGYGTPTVQALQQAIPLWFVFDNHTVNSKNGYIQCRFYQDVIFCVSSAGCVWEVHGAGDTAAGDSQSVAWGGHTVWPCLHGSWLQCPLPDKVAHWCRGRVSVKLTDLFVLSYHY